MSGVARPFARSRHCWNSTTSLPTRPVQKRFLSATASLQVIGPESPRYIEVPQTLQQRDETKTAVKGVLPVPRQILPPRKQYKASAEWLDQTVPAPKNRSEYQGMEKDRVNYKRRLAANRRTSLKEGMSELFVRTITREEKSRETNEHRALSKLRALEAPPRSDEVFTGQTVSKAIRDALAQTTTKRIETEESKQARIAQHQSRVQAKEQKRLENLHTLYLHAKDFITTEEQLKQEIETVFGADDNPVTWTGEKKSVWALNPPPDTATLAGLSSRQQTAFGTVAEHAKREELNNLMKQRMMKIAGKLTGGDIRIPDEISKKQATGADS